jgi:hypothetical protein
MRHRSFVEETASSLVEVYRVFKVFVEFRCGLAHAIGCLDGVENDEIDHGQVPNVLAQTDTSSMRADFYLTPQKRVSSRLRQPGRKDKTLVCVKNAQDIGYLGLSGHEENGEDFRHSRDAAGVNLTIGDGLQLKQLLE